MSYHGKPELAKASDAEAIAKLFMDSFNDSFVQNIYSPHAVGINYMKASWSSFITGHGGQKDAVVRVVRGEDGRIVAALLYWVYHTVEESRTWANRWPAAFPGMDATALASFNSGMEKQHKKVMGTQPHFYGEYLVTDVQTRHKGHGSTLVREALQHADHLGYPFYLDATREAMPFHKSYGFVDHSDEVLTSEIGLPMVRPSRVLRARL